MKLSWYSLYNPAKKLLSLSQGPIYIGKAKDCQLILDSPFIPDRVACIYQEKDYWVIASLVDGMVRVGNTVLARNAKRPLPDEEILQIRPFTIEFSSEKVKLETEESLFSRYFSEAQEYISRIHKELLARNRVLVLKTNEPQSGNVEEDVQKIESDIDSIFEQWKTAGLISSSLEGILAGLYLQGRMLQKFSKELTAGKSLGASEIPAEPWQKMQTQNQSLEAQITDIGNAIAIKIIGGNLNDPAEALRIIDKDFFAFWSNYAKALPSEVLKYLAGGYLKKEIKDLFFGLGPLEDLLNLANISEIMVINHHKIFVEKSGRVQDSGRRFLNEKIAETIIEKIVMNTGVGSGINKSQPLADSRLPDGSRVNAVIAPIAFSGPCLTIRKFPLHAITMRKLVEDQKSLSESCAEFLRAAVVSKKSMIISGGTGTGKTTLLNILGGFIPDQERIITIEDTVEIKLPKEHVVQLEAKPANAEGKGAYSIRDLVKNALRMRPNRIIVGECRGGEALDMLQAMNTGHEGSMTTLHANTSQDAFSRLEVMVQFASAGVSIASIRQMISSSVHLIVQLRRFGSKRQITEVTEVLKVGPDGEIRTSVLFRYDEQTGRLGRTGHLPSFMGELIEKKLIAEDVFYGMSDFNHG